MMNKTKSLGILLAATLLYVVWLSPSMSGPIPQILKPALAQDISSTVKKGLVSYGSMTTANSGRNKSTMVSDKDSPTNTLQLNANEKKGVYTWVNKEGTNPILNFRLNTDNVVQLKNPTDSKHQLVITSEGKEVASSGDIQPGKSSELTFAKLHQGEILEYHCLYHPTTMKGTITISS
jgi:Cupredoxin-like domain